MNQQELNYYKAAASLGLIEDDSNPIFLFSQVRKEILMDIVNGKIDVIEMARFEMEARGLDVNTGKWIGWNSKKIANV